MDENTSSVTVANKRNVIVGDVWDFGGGKYLFVMYYPAGWSRHNVEDLKRFIGDWSGVAPRVVEAGGTYLVRDDLYLEIRKISDVK